MSRTKSERKKKQKKGPVRRLVYQREQKLSHSLGGIVLEEEEEEKRLHLHIAELVTSGRRRRSHLSSDVFISFAHSEQFNLSCVLITASCCCSARQVNSLDIADTSSLCCFTETRRQAAAVLGVGPARSSRSTGHGDRRWPNQ